MQMPTTRPAAHPTAALVEPLLIPCSSAHPWQCELARASPLLWRRLEELSGGSEGVRAKRIGVAMEWARDRRLLQREKGKGSLVVWVEQCESKSWVDTEQKVIYIHPSLMPPISSTPLPVKLYIHQPIELSLVILQSVYDTPEHEALSIPSARRSLARLYGDEDLVPIIRQNRLTPPVDNEKRFKILLSEPTNQGVLSPSTKIILSKTPTYINDPMSGETSDDMVDGMSQSSYSRTHLSLTDFDPDAFLSSSLSLQLGRDEPGEHALGDDEGFTMSSTTSGSVTPRPGGLRPISPPAPIEDVLQNRLAPEDRAIQFHPVPAYGPPAGGVSEEGEGEDVCWLGVSGLGRAGIFEGDWVVVRRVGEHGGRLVKALAWELLDDLDQELPMNPMVLPPTLYRSFSSSTSSTLSTSLTILPTPFGARTPTLPLASTIKLARIATAEGVDKRYERSWLKGQRRPFRIASDGKGNGKGKEKEGAAGRVVRRGDVFAIPVWIDKPISDDERQTLHTITAETESSSDSDGALLRPFLNRKKCPTSLVYFTITSISYDPLVPIEEDFSSSLTAKARAGELGCWVGEETRIVWEGLEKGRIGGRSVEKEWFQLPSVPPPFSKGASAKLHDLLNSTYHQASSRLAIPLSILLKGARGSGKRCLVQHIADELGFNIVSVDCYDIIGDSTAYTSGILLARLSKSISCSPSLLILHHIEALSPFQDGDNPSNRTPPIVKVLKEMIGDAQKSSLNADGDGGWPVVVIGTTADVDTVPSEVLGCFKQQVVIKAPNEGERLDIIRKVERRYIVAPDVDFEHLARQTAALNAGDITALLHQAWDTAVARSSATLHSVSLRQVQQAGIAMTSQDILQALNRAREAYSDSIGAPKIPNVGWDDVGGLVSVKKDILDTIQLPLERPEMFGAGLKKRSGILLYGPPGTGKTLLAKAVATSCSLNFFSVKGPELLNMYIGESEANVRRIFQRARDAAPCVIFMDELDSIAPKRGNQGDSGGVMDRIVSQLLAELDGVASGGGGGGDVFVMGATNRPDLLDPALLRPGRFDKMLYLSIPTTHAAQASILQALTRAFDLSKELDLDSVAEMCPFNYTGADLYALCADAMLNAMTRQAASVDSTISSLSSLAESDPSRKTWPGELTPQYYLSKMAKEDELKVLVGKDDFVKALEKLVPSVSLQELSHYERVRQEFQGFAIGGRDGESKLNGEVTHGKEKGKAREVNGVYGEEDSQ